MRQVYPVVFTKLKDGYMAYVPDFDINTQGDDLAEAIAMARDAIGLFGIDMEDDNKTLPQPSEIKSVEHKETDIISVVDVDFMIYRKANEQRTVRKNVSIPSWLNVEAESANLNFSAILQSALKQALNIPNTQI